MFICLSAAFRLLTSPALISTSSMNMPAIRFLVSSDMASDPRSSAMVPARSVHQTRPTPPPRPASPTPTPMTTLRSTMLTAVLPRARGAAATAEELLPPTQLLARGVAKAADRPVRRADATPTKRRERRSEVIFMVRARVRCPKCSAVVEELSSRR